MAVSRNSADHAAHDELMLAVFASGDDLPAEDLAHVQEWMRDCAECALVVADLRAIQAATADLPAPPRRRDFRLTEEDAARLRVHGWRRILAAFGSPRDRITGPAAAGLATLGVAGLLFLGISGGPTQTLQTVGSPIMATGAGEASAAGGAAAPEAAGAASPAADQMTTRSEAALPSDAKMAPGEPATSEAPVTLIAPDAGTTATGPGDAAGAGAAESPAIAQFAPVEVPGPSEAPVATTAAPDGEGPAPIVVVGLLSVVALAAGLVLAGLRLLGRRMASGG